jgi:hypothetical protein
MRHVAWALVAAAVLATNTGCTGFYLQEFASWRKSLAHGACCPYGYRGCRGIHCGDPCGERGFCHGQCACDCCPDGCMPFGGGCCQGGCWHEGPGQTMCYGGGCRTCCDGPCRGDCGCCPCGNHGCDGGCGCEDLGCGNDCGCCPCGNQDCDGCCNEYSDCGDNCGGCSDGFCGCVDDGGCQGACWDGTCRRKKCSWLCKLGACGEVYWNEWVSDPPDCCDPCNCCGDYIDPLYGRHHAPPEACGDYVGHGHGDPWHGGHGMTYESGMDYSMNHGRSRSSSWTVADGFNSLFAQQPQRPRRAIHVPAIGMDQPRMAAAPTPARRTFGQDRALAGATQPRTQAARHDGRVAKQSPRPDIQQPTPAIEEKVVEGSLKVVEDRAVNEPSRTAAGATEQPAPRVARQPQRKAAPRGSSKPAKPATSRDAPRLDRSI